jgi:hypothetical protein
MSSSSLVALYSVRIPDPAMRSDVCTFDGFCCVIVLIESLPFFADKPAFASSQPPFVDQGSRMDVDIYNVTSRLWTTALLSVYRYSLAAASIGNLAIFAGGIFSDQGTSRP